MQKFASKLLPRAYSAKAVQKDNAHLDQSNTILDNAIAVLQQLADLESATFNVLELRAAVQIGIQIAEILKVRPKTPILSTT